MWCQTWFHRRSESTSTAVSAIAFSTCSSWTTSSSPIPPAFNDPLDTKPNLEADLPIVDLEAVLTRLVVERTKAEMTKAAKSIRYTGPRTIEHIDNHSQSRAARLLDELRYSAGDPAYDGIADPLKAYSPVRSRRNCLNGTIAASSHSERAATAR